MADIILSSCCYNQISYSATSWGGLTAPGTVFSITGDTVIVDGCYTVVTGITPLSATSLVGTATVVTGCTHPSCNDCCDDTICIELLGSTYSAITGTYVIDGSYNGHIYFTGGSNPGYIYFDNTKWCLSTSLGGTCDFYGSLPHTSDCPDFAASILSSGSCPPPTPPPTDPCSVLDFDVLLESLTNTTKRKVDKGSYLR